MLEYTLSVSVCARAATAYGATLFGLQPSYALVNVGFMKMDFCAVTLIAALAVLLSLGTKEGATFNTGELLPSFSAHSSTWQMPCAAIVTCTPAGALWIQTCPVNLSVGPRCSFLSRALPDHMGFGVALTLVLRTASL